MDNWSRFNIALLGGIACGTVVCLIVHQERELLIAASRVIIAGIVGVLCGIGLHHAYPLLHWFLAAFVSLGTAYIAHAAMEEL